MPAFARGGLGQCLVGRARSDSPGASVGAPPASRPCHVPLGRSSCSLADPRRPQQWSHPVQAGGQADGGLAGRCVVCPQWRSLCRAPSGGLCFVPPVEVFVSCPQRRSLSTLAAAGRTCTRTERTLHPSQKIRWCRSRVRAPVLVSLGCTPASAGTRQELTSSRSGGPWQIAPKEAFVFIAWTSELMLLVLALASQQSQRSLRELLGLLLA